MYSLDKRIKHKPLTCFDSVSHLYGELALFSDDPYDFKDLNSSECVIGKIHVNHCHYWEDGAYVTEFYDSSIYQEDFEGCWQPYTYCLPLRWIDAVIRPYKPKEFLKKFPIGTRLRIKNRAKTSSIWGNPKYTKAVVTNAQKYSVSFGNTSYTLKQLFEGMSYADDADAAYPQFNMFAVIEEPKKGKDSYDS